MKTPRFWQSRSLASSLLTPAAALYRLGAWADRTFTSARHAPIPVISIGNVTAGGAGKTPTTLALVPVLQALGYTPHILTRGYKAAVQTAHRVSADDDWRAVGDEALLLAAAAPTWVGRDRHAAASAAAAAGATILICDDALQHHALFKNISLLIIDGAYGLGNGRLLPAGPLRESLASGLARSHGVIMIGEDAQNLSPSIHLPILHATLAPQGDVSFLRAHRWLAFAGIGRPEKFFATARAAGADITATRTFADHHAYSDTDITGLLRDAETLGLRLLTTAKDAVKIPPHHHASIAVLPVTLGFSNPAFVSDFLAKMLHAPQLS